MNFPAASQAIVSPCIGVCTLDEHDQCTGCHRTADEIARWAQYSPAERERVMEALPYRAPASGED